MPKLISITRLLEKDDRVEGSSEKARAVWALGHLKKPSNAATVARVIRARTAVNWEGGQASRFFRRNCKSPLFIRHLQENGRYLFSLSELGQKVFNEMFISDGDVKTIDDHPGSNDIALFRGKAARADPVKLTHINEQLKQENTRYRKLLTEILTCHYEEVEDVLEEIATVVGIKNWRYPS